MPPSRAVKAILGADRQSKDERGDFLQLASGAKLTPATLTGAIQEADRGQIRRLVEVVNDLRARDAHLAGVEATRRSAVAGKPWELRPGRIGNRETSPLVMDACKTMLAQLAGWESFAGDCQDAVLQPLAAFELSWDRSEGIHWPVAIDWVHPHRLFWNTYHEGLTVKGEDSPIRLRELRLRTIRDITYGERLKPFRWVIHQLRLRADYPWRLGLGRPIAWLECFKGHTWAWWAEWIEVCANPKRFLNLPEGASDEALAEGLAMLKAMGSYGFGAMRGEGKVTVLDANNAGDQSYDRFSGACNGEISKVLLGHTGSADSTPSKLGGENMASEIRQDLVEMDASGIASTGKRDVLTPFVRLNWPEEPVPECALQVGAQMYRKVLMELAKEGWSMGVLIDREELALRCNLPATKDPSRALPGPGPQGMASVAAGVNAPQPTPSAVPIPGAL